VTVNSVPTTAIITPGGPIDICDDGSNSPVVLNADTTGAGAGASILWNDVNNTPTNTLSIDNNSLEFIINGNNQYDFSFTVTNANGCNATSNVVRANLITCNPPPPTSVTLNAKVLIEGYYTGNGLMDNYGAGGCLFVNQVPGATMSDADTLRISLMESGSPYNEVATQTGILHTDGNISVTFPTGITAGNSYYIKITHRNALETWSANPVIINSTTTYDFTTAANKAYGNNMVESFDAMGWMIYSGDISDANNLGLGVGYQDGIADSQDYSDMENAVSVILSGYVAEDVTGDGIVESSDYSLMENAVGAIRFANRP
jgi:hypothetical protein